jgi:hypothetical protein
MFERIESFFERYSPLLAERENQSFRGSFLFFVTFFFLFKELREKELVFCFQASWP